MRQIQTLHRLQESFNCNIKQFLLNLYPHKNESVNRFSFNKKKTRVKTYLEEQITFHFLKGVDGQRSTKKQTKVGNLSSFNISVPWKACINPLLLLDMSK